MLIRRGQHTDLDAQAEAEPADSVVTRDYYTQLPQIRLTASSTDRSMHPGQIFRFGLEAPPGLPDIRKIVAEELDKRASIPESPASNRARPAGGTLLPRMPLP